MQQSNTYIILFSVGLTVVLGGLLAFAATSLKPAQQRSVELDTQKQILNAVINTSELNPQEIQGKYKAQIESFVVNYQGEEITDDGTGKAPVAEKVNIRKEFKKITTAEKLVAAQKQDAANEILASVQLPVFKFAGKGEGEEDAYILPTYGNGLWNNIWGFIALKSDLNTIKGVSFDHVGETPGLGARITESEIQGRYKDKQIYDGGALVSVTMVKGEGTPEANLGSHKVDGMSGATLTANGVNAMLELYFKCYEPYLKRIAEVPVAPKAVAEVY